MGLKSTWSYGRQPQTGIEKMFSRDSYCRICLVMITMAGFSLARPSDSLVGEETTSEPGGKSTFLFCSEHDQAYCRTSRSYRSNYMSPVFK